MGNQMFQYAMGRALADRLGVPLKLDLSGYRRHPPRPYALHHFAIRAEEASPAEVGELKPALPPYERFARKLGLLGGRPPRRITSRTCFYESTFYHFDRRIDALEAPVYVDGFWQSARYFEHIRPTLQRDFAITTPLDPGAAPLLDRVRDVEAVCVHVRRGDYASDPIFWLLTPEYYERAVGEMLARVRSPVFVVFADDPTWARSELRLPEPVIWTFEHGKRSAIEDTRLMLACKHFVIANSTFSWWPAFLSDPTETVVVRPTRWFRNEAWEADELDRVGWIAL